MIEVSTTTESPASVPADALVVSAVRSDDEVLLSPEAEAVDEASGGALRAHLDATGFEAKLREVTKLAAPGCAAPLVVLVGLGDHTDDGKDASLRRTAGVAARAVDDRATVAVAMGELDSTATAALVEGWMLGAYRFVDFKSEPELAKTERLVVVGGDPAAARRGALSARATWTARDLSNRPAGNLTPTALAAEAIRLGEAAGLRVEVWEPDRIEQERLGGLLTVAAGSAEEPRLIRLEYEPEGDPAATIALVGKGITFDSGGLSIKPADGMMTMKTDMSGAAAVLAAMSVLGELQPRVRVLAFVPATENLPSGTAVKPGDVFTARNGKTVEVLNTDAEGRLILADGLSLAAEAEPDAIVDLATLTGACVVALGQDIAGLFAADDELAGRIEAAASAAGEDVWRLPLHKPYRKRLDSEIADLRNIATGSGAGATTAALFLQEFTDDTPWAHIDIAGPSRVESTDGHIVKGSSGFGAALLVELLARWSA